MWRPFSFEVVEGGANIVKNVASLGLSVFLAAGFALWTNTKQAYAYIDVGSATFFIQILIASAFGGLFTLKVFWQRILGRVSRIISAAKGTRKSS